MAGETNSPNSGTRVLVVEDAPEFQLVVCSLLEANGYSVESAVDGASGLEAARTFDPAVVILDLGLPDMDGMSVCEELRSFTDAYVLMLTGRTEDEDRYRGLEVGADDYLTKPFEAKELLLRISVLLRRPRAGTVTEITSGPVEYGDLRIDRLAHQIWVGDNEIHLTKIEFAMLQALTTTPGAALSRRELAESVWGPHWVGEDHVINVHVANLRKKIDADAGGRIATVRGIGYRFETRPLAA